LAHVLIGEPVSTPDQVRGRLSPGRARSRIATASDSYRFVCGSVVRR
jgi:hypothetical protein